MWLNEKKYLMVSILLKLLMEYILNQIQYTLEHTAVKTLIEYKLDKVYEKYKPILENEIVRWKYTF